MNISMNPAWRRIARLNHAASTALCPVSFDSMHGIEPAPPGCPWGGEAHGAGHGQACEHMYKSANRLKTLVNDAPFAIVTLNPQGEIMFWSRRAEAMFGWSEAEVIGGALPFIGEEARARFDELLGRCLLGESLHDIEFGDQKTGLGKRLDVQLSLSPLPEYDGLGNCVLLTVTDISPRRQAERRLHYLSTHDELTGLPNRVLFGDRLEQLLLRRPQGQAPQSAVLMLQLDGMRKINESFGFQRGDEVLREVAMRLRGMVREGDSVARYSGHGFLVLLHEIERPQDAALVARKILKGMEAPFRLDEDVYLTGHIGITLAPVDGADARTLLCNAEIAARRAREACNEGYFFFTQGMNEEARSRLHLAADLRRALQREEFILHYQPQIDFSTGHLVGIEALVRWQHPELGFMPPNRFIPIAEEEGLIGELGAWILRRACREAALWGRSGSTLPRLAVNLSTRQFVGSDLQGYVDEVLESSGLPADRLELEITESTLAQDPDFTASVLRGFKDKGIGIAIDDFGTGYSSLSYLKRFPLDALKIDRSFVLNAPHDADDSSICQAVVAMAKSLRMRVVAEGVEHDGHVDYLRGLGCDEGQGYHFARPLPASEMAELIAAERRFLAPRGAPVWAMSA